MKNTHWKLKDVILLALIGIIFSVVYFILAPLCQFLTGGLAAVGLQPFSYDITWGAWMMAAPLASYILKKPGAGFLAEFIGAAGEMFLGSYWGVSALISGVIQGIASELGFTITLYKNYNLGLWLSTLTGTVVTFTWSLISMGYASYGFGMLVMLFIVRYLSMLFFGGVLVYGIQRLLDRSKFLSRGEEEE